VISSSPEQCQPSGGAATGTARSAPGSRTTARCPRWNSTAPRLTSLRSWVFFQPGFLRKSEFCNCSGREGAKRTHTDTRTWVPVRLTAPTPPEPTGQFQSRSKWSRDIRRLGSSKFHDGGLRSAEKRLHRERGCTSSDVSELTGEGAVLLLSCLRENPQSEVTIRQRRPGSLRSSVRKIA